MNAKKCDRCGKLYDKKFPDTAVGEIYAAFVHGFKTLRFTKGQRDIYDGVDFYFDLCPECLESFKEWICAKKGCDDAEEQEAENVEC